jgi:hypothetical protein
VRTLVVVVLLASSLSTSGGAQDHLTPVRELYATADYEGALAALSRVRETRTDSSVVPETDHYRVLCLIALNRLKEAEQTIEKILKKDPLYQLTAEEAPPRVRAAFEQVRIRIVPTVARELYEAGKDAFDRKAFAEAVDVLERVLRIVDTPATIEAPGLRDLKVLATGFRDLSRASLLPGVTRAAAAPPPTAMPRPSQAAVTDPVPIRQVLPPWVGAAGGTFFDRDYSGTLEIEIDEHGLVTVARMTEPVHPAYDPRLLASARTWVYEPARQSGVAVRAIKRIDIHLRPDD